MGASSTAVELQKTGATLSDQGIDVEVLNVSLGAPMTVVYLDQADYTTGVCPICKTDAESVLLTDVRCGDLTSLESAFCRRCEHRYFRKIPSADWYHRYYAMEWDTGWSAVRGPRARAKAVLGAVPWVRATGRFLKYGVHGRRNQRTLKILSTLSGLIQWDGGVCSALQDVKKVLEVGCGYGDTLEEFRHRGFLAYGAEASPYRVRHCRQRGLNVFECPVDSIQPLAPLAPFDLIYSAHVLEHIADPALHLNHLVPLIRDGGYLYIQVPHAILGESVVQQAHYAGHCHSFSPRALCLLLAAAGLTPVRMHLDKDIQVLARNTGPVQPHLIYEKTADPRHYLELFESLVSHQGRRLWMTWGSASSPVVKARDGQPLNGQSQAVRGTERAGRDSMEFIVWHSASHGPALPIRFRYQGDRPPIWIKRN